MQALTYPNAEGKEDAEVSADLDNKGKCHALKERSSLLTAMQETLSDFIVKKKWF